MVWPQAERADVQAATQSLNAKHYAHSSEDHLRVAPTSEEAAEGVAADITFTATSSASGSLLLGSSREFVDVASNVSAQASHAVVEAILERAQVGFGEQRKMISALCGQWQQCCCWDAAQGLLHHYLACLSAVQLPGMCSYLGWSEDLYFQT
eukprot:scaffold217410_cov23-Tisochrysis_lutea.AAC.1